MFGFNQRRSENRKQNQDRPRGDIQPMSSYGAGSSTGYGRGYRADDYENYDENDRGYRRGYAQNRGPGESYGPSLTTQGYGRPYGSQQDVGFGGMSSASRPGLSTYRGENQFGGGWMGGQQDGQRQEERHVGRGPKGYQRSDERIYEDVCERLAQDSDVDASEMEVEVQNGEVTLRGSVPEKQMKRRAEDVIDQVSGVKDIHNHIRVQASTFQDATQAALEEPELQSQSEAAQGTTGKSSAKKASKPARNERS